MATLTGIIHLEGTLDGLTFYMRLGKKVVRRAGGPSADKIRRSEKCARVRENIDEFYHGAVPAAQQLRISLKEFRHLWEPNVSGRLNAFFRRDIIEGSEGLRGQRPVKLQDRMLALQQFRFGNNSLETVFAAPYTCTMNETRNRAELIISSFDAGRCIKAPEGATHFRLLFGMAVLSEYVFVKSGQRYQPTDPLTNGKSVVVSSEFMRTVARVNTFTLLAELENIFPRESSAVPVCLGIEFYQEAGGKLYRLKGQGGMAVIRSV